MNSSRWLLRTQSARTVLMLAIGLWQCVSCLAATCEGLRELQISRATITAVELIRSGRFTPPGGKPVENLPAFCRVAATLAPTTDSAIRIELWMPESGRNARFLGTGNGGFAGNLAWGSLAGGLREGFAVVNTDMGMQPPAGSDAGAFVGHPEKWADWGYRSTHEMTIAAKLLVRAYYGNAPKYSYFSGCSTGGEQALMEAQRFPDDYDRILAGAAANNRTGVHTSILWNYAVNERTPSGYLPPSKLPALADAVVTACDSLDGLTDGLVSDPQACRFDPSTLLCRGADSEKCLTAAQVQTVRNLYSGPVNPRTRDPISPGIMPGSETTWTRFAADPEHPPYEPIFKWVHGVTWKWRTFDFDRDYTAMVSKVGPVLNAVSPDLHAFEARGGKLIVYHGWADPLVVPGEAIKYREAVVARRLRDSGRRATPATARADTDRFYRLFMIPGMRTVQEVPDSQPSAALNLLWHGWSDESPRTPSSSAAKSADSLSGAPSVRIRRSHNTRGLVPPRTRPVSSVSSLPRLPGDRECGTHDSSFRPQNELSVRSGALHFCASEKQMKIARCTSARTLA